MGKENVLTTPIENAREPWKTKKITGNSPSVSLVLASYALYLYPHTGRRDFDLSYSLLKNRGWPAKKTGNLGSGRTGSTLHNTFP